MSKTRLGELLGEHGIVYESRKALGTPPDIRFQYKSGKPAEGAPLFRAHVEVEHAAHELDDLADELDRGPRTALLCLEADPAVCHRRVLTELLCARRPGLQVVDSRVRPMEEGRQHYGVTLGLLTIAGVSFALMQTLVVPALPFFPREFHTSASWVTWIATGFLLSSSVLTPILGKLGDSHGKKKMLVISLAIFGLASLAAAAAWSLASLVFFRVLQGAGAAVFPLSFGIIRDEFPPDKVGVGIGTVSSVFGAGGGIGLVLSGVIIEHLSWHWLFLIGAVPVLCATVLLALFVPESPVKTPAKPDYVGGAALSVALGTLLIAISEGSHWGWTSAGVLGLVAASAVMFFIWVRIEKRVPEPLVDLKTFARREMAATNLRP